MNMARLNAIAGRRTAAGLVLVVTLILSFWIDTYKEWMFIAGGRVGFGPFPMMRYTPAWATPVALAVGVTGAFLALLIYLPNRISRR